jgi:hypothetical protein
MPSYVCAEFETGLRINVSLPPETPRAKEVEGI